MYNDKYCLPVNETLILIQIDEFPLKVTGVMIIGDT